MTRLLHIPLCGYETVNLIKLPIKQVQGQKKRKAHDAQPKIDETARLKQPTVPAFGRMDHKSEMSRGTTFGAWKWTQFPNRLDKDHNVIVNVNRVLIHRSLLLAIHRTVTIRNV